MRKRKNMWFVETSAEDQQGAGISGGEDAGFTPPASQDELNRIIADRLSRERAKYADYDSLKSAAEKLAELEEASKTAEQKQAERLAELEARVAEYETRDQLAAWKSEIVKDSHIPTDLLRGTTREELENHFEQLKSVIPEPAVQAGLEPARFIIPAEGLVSSPSKGSDEEAFGLAIQQLL